MSFEYILLHLIIFNYAYSKTFNISAETVEFYENSDDKKIYSNYGKSHSEYKEGNQGCALTLSLSQPQYDDICPMHELANLRKQVTIVYF